MISADYETDRRLFPHRHCHLTRRRDSCCLSFIVAVSVLLNVPFMNNIGWFLFYIYGTLSCPSGSFSSVTRFKISPLALVTHNPVMMILNLYTIFVCYKAASVPADRLAGLYHVFPKSDLGKFAARFAKRRDRDKMYSSFLLQKATRFIEVVTLLIS